MMQSDFSFSTYQSNIPIDQDSVDGAFFPSLMLSEDTSMASSDSYLIPNMFLNSDVLDDDDMNIIYDWIYGTQSHSSEGFCCLSPSLSPSLESSQNSTEMVIDLPKKETKLEKEVILPHLLRGYGEAMSNGNRSLARVIARSIKEKSSSKGNSFLERVAYHMFDDRALSLRQESMNNFAAAFSVVYGSFMCGRFAHNAANAAILESVPDHVRVMHIVDFDVGEGIQWAALIAAMSGKHKVVALRLTAIKQEWCNWEFEETKKRLHDHAREYGLNVQIEEKSIQDFTEETRRKRKKNGTNEWVAFNCMVALGHMGRRRRRRRVVEFLEVAEELLAYNEGIVTFGDGEAMGDEVRSYESYYGKLLKKYEALFEALECSVPGNLAEARTAIESLFLAPMVCPVEWFQEWEEITINHEFEFGFKFKNVSEGPPSGARLEEARVMVSEREEWYNVRMEGNEMVLRWKENVLVRVSTYYSKR